jgi:hypothetical protein
MKNQVNRAAILALYFLCIFSIKLFTCEYSLTHSRKLKSINIKYRKSKIKALKSFANSLERKIHVRYNFGNKIQNIGDYYYE